MGLPLHTVTGVWAIRMSYILWKVWKRVPKYIHITYIYIQTWMPKNNCSPTITTTPCSRDASAPKDQTWTNKTKERRMSRMNTHIHWVQWELSENWRTMDFAQSHLSHFHFLTIFPLQCCSILAPDWKLLLKGKWNHVPAKILQFARFHLKMNCVAKWKLLNYRMHMKEDQTNCCFYPNKLNFITSGALLTFPKRQWQAKQCTIVHLYHWNKKSKRLIGGLLSVLLSVDIT